MENQPLFLEETTDVADDEPEKGGEFVKGVKGSISLESNI